MSSEETVTLPIEQARALAAAAMYGDALMGWIASTALTGHASPGSTLDYVQPEAWSGQAFVADFVAWTSGRKHMRPDCEDRLREWGMTQATQRMGSLFDKALEPQEQTS